MCIYLTLPARVEGTGGGPGGGGRASDFARERLGFAAEEKQRAVLDSTAKRGILNCSRQWGKSTVLAAKAVHRAWTEKDCLVLVASPSARQSGEFLLKARRFVKALGVRAKGDGVNELSLALPNGSRIVGLPGEEGTVRGFSAVSLLAVDEASRVPESLYRALRPMLAVKDGDLWLMSTPFGKRGFFWETWERGEGWERHKATAAECGRISAGFLEGERRDNPESYMRQEYECEFVDSEDQWFREEVVRQAVTEEKGW